MLCISFCTPNTRRPIENDSSILRIRKPKEYAARLFDASRERIEGKTTMSSSGSFRDDFSRSASHSMNLWNNQSMFTLGSHFSHVDTSAAAPAVAYPSSEASPETDQFAGRGGVGWYQCTVASQRQSWSHKQTQVTSPYNTGGSPIGIRGGYRFVGPGSHHMTLRSSNEFGGIRRRPGSMPSRR